MRKNRMMRLASALLILTMVTTCAISGTFAKYVTEVTATDTARVARWGFTGEDADIAITNLFLNAYDNVTGADSDVIAPGTSNKATFVFEYSEGTTDVVEKPEVAYSFVVDASASSCAQTIKDNANIKWAVLKTTELEAGEVPTGQWGTWQAMIDEINALDGDKNYDPDELPDMSNVEYTIAWKWDYSVDEAGDIADTTMGNAGDLADVTVQITITATQLD